MGHCFIFIIDYVCLVIIVLGLIISVVQCREEFPTVITVHQEVQAVSRKGVLQIHHDIYQVGHVGHVGT